MKLTLITLTAVLLTACSVQDKADSQKTYTVQELLKEPALYKKISDWCSENPVSYTHLDVYKRQLLKRLYILKAFKKNLQKTITKP